MKFIVVFTISCLAISQSAAAPSLKVSVEELSKVHQLLANTLTMNTAFFKKFLGEPVADAAQAFKTSSSEFITQATEFSATATTQNAALIGSIDALTVAVRRIDNNIRGALFEWVDAAAKIKTKLGEFVTETTKPITDLLAALATEAEVLVTPATQVQTDLKALQGALTAPPPTTDE
ncbi:uncharacterized protein LOC129756844 [Uranotaenia lowii]|uniref:uncharacterized protein LOC129756844 n=1 Tax=Uranotaenia lowii TaxID=190385 RepID=UPI00247A577E|nr:uncharacterized protein LOC129756844 [Uranotaenia lowii]